MLFSLVFRGQDSGWQLWNFANEGLGTRSVYREVVQGSFIEGFGLGSSCLCHCVEERSSFEFFFSFFWVFCDKFMGYVKVCFWSLEFGEGAFKRCGFHVSVEGLLFMQGMGMFLVV